MFLGHHIRTTSVKAARINESVQKHTLEHEAEQESERLALLGDLCSVLQEPVEFMVSERKDWVS